MHSQENDGKKERKKEIGYKPKRMKKIDQSIIFSLFFYSCVCVFALDV